jgi:hypothetical protein
MAACTMRAGVSLPCIISARRSLATVATSMCPGFQLSALLHVLACSLGWQQGSHRLHPWCDQHAAAILWHCMHPINACKFGCQAERVLNNIWLFRTYDIVTAHVAGRSTTAGGLRRRPGGSAVLPQPIPGRQIAPGRVRHPPGKCARSRMSTVMYAALCVARLRALRSAAT